MLSRGVLAIFWGIVMIFLLSRQGLAQIELDTSRSADFLVKEILLGQGVLVGNVKFTGEKHAIGTFTDESNQIDITKGIILTSGSAFYSKGPNRSPFMGWASGSPGDGDLNNITSGLTFDAAVLEFDFITTSENLVFNYVFASEEYLEYVNSKFNDVFGFFINGPGLENENIARLPDSGIPITINNVNHERNTDYFVDNSFENPEPEFVYNPRKKKVVRNKNFHIKREMPKYDIQFDGFTVVLQAKCRVVPNEIYHIKMAIADVSDGILDSGVFLEAGSFRSYGDEVVEISKKIPELDQTIAKLELKSVIEKEDLPDMHLKVQESVNFGDVQFEFDSYDLPTDYMNMMNEVYQLLAGSPSSVVEVRGHTCHLGSDEYNSELSKKRANSVAQYLLALGVDREKIKTTYFGEEKPIEPNSTESGRKRNRRVELVVRLPQ